MRSSAERLRKSVVFAAVTGVAKCLHKLSLSTDSTVPAKEVRRPISKVGEEARQQRAGSADGMNAG